MIKRLFALFLLAFPCAAQRYLSGTPEISLSLNRLRVLGSVLMIAAHPDDENTAALAYWARGRNLETAYLSATRGEGGQNLIGSEQGDLLGVIRTQELLEARRIDGAGQFFTRAIDFGFTKTPAETFAKWGHDEILSDMVWVIRRYRPDVVVLRFSGTPRDGHGQHQASAILGKEAYFAAADETRYPEQLKYAAPWQAKRLMYNVLSFTPEMEKEAAAAKGKIEFDTGQFNPVLGKSYAEIAGLSRSEHRSQAMGSAERKGPSKNYLITLAGDAAKTDLFDGIDTSWKRLPGGAPVGDLLDQAVAAFAPQHPEKTIPSLLRARSLVAGMAAANNLWAARKLKELDEAIALCSGLWIDAESNIYAATPGGKTTVTLNAINRSVFGLGAVRANIVGLGLEQTVEVAPALADNALVAKPVELTVPPGAKYSEPFWLSSPHDGSRYHIADPLLIGRPDPVPVMIAEFTVQAGAEQLRLTRPVHYRYVDRARGELTRPFIVAPPVSVDLPSSVLVFTNGDSRALEVQVKSNIGAASGEVRVEADAGWRIEPASRPFQLRAQGEQQELTFTVSPISFGPENGPVPAHFRASARVGSTEIRAGVDVIDYTHIEPQTVLIPSDGLLRKAPLTVLAKHVGYVMGAGDQVPESLRQMGCDVTLLSSDDLTRGDLRRFDAIVTGVRAYNVRSDLRANRQRLLDYMRNGGTLLVQYNVMEDRRFGRATETGLGELGPYPFKLGRERVTVEEAPVEFLSMKGPLLRVPNIISAHDFDGWVQERGLYFASEWDPRYQTVFSSHDPDEKGLPGGTLFARYGKGAYVFSSYSWFRQLPAGVPGAYRIFANLLSAGKAQ
ncbi:MAG: PIG-L family deacetylase [Acidobacteriota bacterium]|nr:PIG-L family deacetylase [Acidobacteriota bacterium]